MRQRPKEVKDVPIGTEQGVTVTPELYTVDRLADEQKLSTDTIYDWLKAGELRGFKLGVAWRIHPDDWDEFINRRRGIAS